MVTICIIHTNFMFAELLNLIGKEQAGGLRGGFDEVFRRRMFFTSQGEFSRRTDYNWLVNY